jgi:AcrR family transcriptional regulator
MDKRRQILEAAERVFRSKGLTGATTREIARDAGCADGTLYLHFADRLALLSAVLDACLPDFRESLDNLKDLAGKRTVRLNFEMVAASCLNFFEQMQPVACSLFAEPGLLEAHRRHLREQGRGPHISEALVSAYIRAEQKLGRIDRRASPESLYSMLLGACFHRVFISSFMGESASPANEVFVRKLVDNLLRGMRPESSRLI